MTSNRIFHQRSHVENSSAAQTSEMLRRILAAVEGNQRKRWVEITCALVLALATMASAWCAYQSTLWGGVQTFKLAAAAKAAREAAKLEIEALETRMFDKLLFVHYVEHRGAETSSSRSSWRNGFVRRWR